MNDNSVRTVGEYKVVNAIHIGDKEIILGENMQAADNNFYMVCFSERNDIFEYYNNILVSDNFIEIAEIFSDRLREQIDSVKKEIENESVEHTLITKDMCDNTMQDDLVGKILVVNPEVLRCEYRVDTHQIYKATGGNGASVNARGNAVFCRNIFTGRDTRFQRYDFIGELKKEYYPDWLKQRNEHDRQNNSQTPGRDIHKSEKGVER